MAALAHDVLVLGGGHAGVRAARAIARGNRLGEQLDVALVSRDNVELWHGLMPQMLSNAVQPRHVVVPLREVLPGTHIYTYEIREVDLERQRVTIDRGTDGEELILGYRYLVLAVGSVIDLSRFPGMAEHALPTKTVGDFVHLRNHAIGMLEQASEEVDAALRVEQLTFVVAGASFAGVEVAAELDELIRTSLPLYRRLHRRDIRILCVDPAPRVLPTLSEAASAMARRHLERRGIEVRMSTGVTSASAHAARLSNGDVIRTRTLVATAGTGTNPLIQRMPLTLDRGRVRCNAFGHAEGWRNVFAAGDVAAIPDANGTPHPPTVTFAVAEGETVGANVVAASRNEPPRRLDHTGVEMVAILSRSFGVAEVRGRPLEGRLAVLAGRWTFLRYMPNWRRRARLLLDWMTAGLFAEDVTQLQVARSHAISQMRFAPGDEIVRQGELGNFFYIISEGQVEVLEGGAREGRTLRRLGPGDHFGELALAAGTRRTATVRALTETTVIALDRRDFGAISDSLPGFRDQFERDPYAMEPSDPLPNPPHKGEGE
jgi:NADH:ubiquinone reductase (H+-translocating)